MPTQKITANSRKQDMFDAYQAAQSKIKDLESKTLNPKEVVKRKRQKQAVEKVNGLSLDSVETGINTVQSRTQKLLTELSGQLQDGLTQYNELQEAIEAKSEELGDVFGIEREATSLAALMDAQATKKEQFEQELLSRRQAFDEEMVTARKKWSIEKEEYNRTSEQERAQFKQDMERQLEDFKYDFSRKERERLDALEDQLSTERKNFDSYVETREKELSNREEVLAKQEQEVADLRAKVEEIPDLVAEAEAKGRASAGQSHGFEVRALKSKHEAETAVLNAQNEALNKQVAHLEADLDKTQEKLDAAYEKMNATAQAALAAKSNEAATRAAIDAVGAASGKSR